MALNQLLVAQCCPICKGNSAIRELLSASPSCPFSMSSSSLSEPLPLLMLLSSPLSGRGGPSLSVALGLHPYVLFNSLFSFTQDV